MKLILRADVENLGSLGDVVVVKAGFGRNYLLPQGLAMVASPANLKVFEQERKKLQEKMDALRSTATVLCAKLEALDVVIKMRVGENDKLYGSVTSSMLGTTFADLGVEVDRHRILLDSPIRVLGEHTVRVRLHADVMAHVLVKVVSEDKPVEEDIPAVAKNDDSVEAADDSAE
ncbi:MAG: 50S ribosomal protein L9 [Desulfovibrionaceae bacterium]